MGKGIILNPDSEHGIKCYVNANFAGCWSSNISNDKSSTLSHTGYVIFYHGCPIIWASKMQMEMSLSTTEAEYISRSQEMRDLITFLNLTQELQTVFHYQQHLLF